MQKMVLWGFPEKSPLFFHDPSPLFCSFLDVHQSSTTRKLMETTIQPLRLHGEEASTAFHVLLQTEESQEV